MCAKYSITPATTCGRLGIGDPDDVKDRTACHRSTMPTYYAEAIQQLIDGVKALIHQTDTYSGRVDLVR